METEQNIKPSKKTKSIQFHVIVAIIFYFVDALVFQQGVITFLVTMIFVLNGIVKIAISFFKTRLILKSLIWKMGIYILCFLAAYFTIRTNDRIATKRFEQIKNALQQYKTKYNRCPESLQNLVPEFLPSIPNAKYGFISKLNQFHYFTPSGNRNSMVYYIDFPPFGRPTYTCETDSSNYLD